MTVAEAVHGDAVFAIQAQPEVAEADAEADQQQRFEGRRRLAAAREQEHGERDREHDRDVAGRAVALHRRIVGQSISASSRE